VESGLVTGARRREDDSQGQLKVEPSVLGIQRLRINDMSISNIGFSTIGFIAIVSTVTSALLPQHAKPKEATTASETVSGDFPFAIREAYADDDADAEV
jgi:hypothetical protein